MSDYFDCVFVWFFVIKQSCLGFHLELTNLLDALGLVGGLFYIVLSWGLLYATLKPLGRRPRCSVSWHTRHFKLCAESYPEINQNTRSARKIEEASRQCTSLSADWWATGSFSFHLAMLTNASCYIYVTRILKKRALELDARRQEAQLLLKYAAKLDREERKVAALESRALKVYCFPKTPSSLKCTAAHQLIPLFKALTKPSIRRRQEMEPLKVSQPPSFIHEGHQIHMPIPKPRSASLSSPGSSGSSSSSNSRPLPRTRRFSSLQRGPSAKPAPHQRQAVAASMEGESNCLPNSGSPTPGNGKFAGSQHRSLATPHS